MKQKKNFKSKLNLACANDELRQNLRYIIFENGKAVCTDGYILVAQQLKLHGFEEEEVKLLEGYAIHKNVFKEVYKKQQVKVLEQGILECYDKDWNKTMIQLVKLEDLGLKFLDWKKVILTKKQSINEFGIDMKIVSKVKDLTLNSIKHVRVELYGANKGMVLSGLGLGIEEELILVMPLDLT